MDDGAADRTPIPDDAFALLGDETRLGILQALGDADRPLAFSALRDRVAVRDWGRFNYHIDRLVEQFVDRDDHGYYLARPGRRVIAAILSGAVTDRPELERTAIDRACGYCGAPVEIAWRAGSVEVDCTECPGTFGRRGGDEELGRRRWLHRPDAVAPGWARGPHTRGGSPGGRRPGNACTPGDVPGGLCTLVRRARGVGLGLSGPRRQRRPL